MASSESFSISTTSSTSNFFQNYFKQLLKSRKFQSILFAWIVGICFMFFSPPPIALTKEMKKEFQIRMKQSLNQEGYQEALQQFYEAQKEVDQAKTWFWRFNSEARETVAWKQSILDEQRDVITAYETKKQQMQQKAKQKVGLWSEIGMQEVRTRFWQAFESGKVFAQRQTFWQMLFSVLNGHSDQNVLSLLLEWVVVAVLNFTFCLMGALLYFMGTLGWMIWEYQPNPLSGMSFFLLSLMGGIAIVTGFLIGMYGMVLSTGYVIGKSLLADANRLTFEERRRLYQQEQRQRQGRPHYD